MAKKTQVKQLKAMQRAVDQVNELLSENAKPQSTLYGTIDGYKDSLSKVVGFTQERINRINKQVERMSDEERRDYFNREYKV